MPEAIDPLKMIRPRRKITGMSAILLPFQEDGAIDWKGFDAHAERTADAGLAPAVNMDTGYVNLIDDTIRKDVLTHTQRITAGKRYVAGAFVLDQPGDKFNLDGYRRQTAMIQEFGGTPVIFPSFGFAALGEAEILEAYRAIGKDCPQFVGFELGKMFAPFGRIFELETYGGMMEIPQCIGAKHSSLSRELEWQRILLRDEKRPDFHVFTGNDLAIDMVIYGSDYLLGLSTFAPDLFAKRDAMWLAGDPEFYQLNDLLQYVGFFAFRTPTPGYKHNAAMMLKARGWLGCDKTHPKSPHRPESDREVIAEIAEKFSAYIQ